MMVSKSNIAASSNAGITQANASNQKVDSTYKSEKVSRVEELKAQIKNGEYKVDLDQTAQKVVESLF